ncbi:hypothetical protein CYMTET_45624 [Cymbomonas tetramitiformis]|uniref:EF-hand domain-containing protein n=1 Tax=Cymbomonas tetramitiformis TaxID=36881 RepID=A0AAE0EZI2_9CHLO|nr:hypothetical protein CYMTET_45624 [Cymbomonas tetramitiformis]|eukprot:gene10113-11970_t
MSTGIDWQLITSKLPAGKTAEEKAARSELFKQFDVHSNGILSLAEVDKGIRDVLQCDVLFNCKPAIMRAFQAAKGAHKSTKLEAGPDSVERIEFRLLLSYLRQYFELYQMFAQVDSSGDRRISLSEFVNARDKIKRWGLEISDPEAQFQMIDKNGGGLVLFDEFAEWAIKENLDLEDNDD